MIHGFIKVAAASIKVRVADVDSNTESIKNQIKTAEEKGVNLLVLPELCITGYTCGDLFFSHLLQEKSKDALIKLKKFTADSKMLTVVGLPLTFGCKLYNCAAVLQNGQILAIIPKTFIPNHGEFYEKRYFASANDIDSTATINIGGEEIPFGNNIVLCHGEMPSFSFGVEICEDLWVASSPAEKLALLGATIIANPSASNEYLGKADTRRMLVSSNSARLVCGYVFACASQYESTQDTVYSNHHLICEDGKILVENPPLSENDMIVSEIDTDMLFSKRLTNSCFAENSCEDVRKIIFSQTISETTLTRKFDKNPFVPSCNPDADFETALTIQATALKKRIEHTYAKKLVIGISGGLDSTLALLVCARAVDMLSRPRTDILAVTMPCFGTTDRTKSNAISLCEELGVELREINITKSVTQHFEDIGQDKTSFDVTFENSQARERTQVLMDVANMENGLVIGTGDLSELALGWATYNGDQMSMYGVNASVPKTLVRLLVGYEAQKIGGNIGNILKDIIDTPVSPELLPTDENGNIKQKTEDLVGPYELHDFFLYNLLKNNFSAKKVLRLATKAFEGEYSKEIILHWLKVFVRRFFTQQFKRSCMPDGPKVTEISLSPRSDLRMPTDASANMWLRDLENI